MTCKHGSASIVCTRCDLEIINELEGRFTNDMLSCMIALCADQFQLKYDRGGHPYILHCLRVMHKVIDKYHDYELATIAVGHDLTEDTDVTDVKLLTAGYTPRIVCGIRALDKTGKTEAEYEQGLLNNVDAMRVKLEDLEDNMDVLRLKKLSPHVYQRLEKYHTQYRLIRDRLITMGKL